MTRVINIRNIPEDLFWQFKAECAQNHIDMTTAMLRFMYFFIQPGEWEVAKGDSKKRSRNLFVAIEQSVGDNVTFSVCRNDARLQ
jgi:hypothetical protein